MGIITAFAKSIDNSQLLRLLHQQIEKQDAPVACRDDLDDQLTDIAAYMHDEHYPALAKRRKKVNMLTGLLALPVLLFSLLLFSQKIIDALSLNIDISYLSLTLLDYSPFLVTIRYLTPTPDGRGIRSKFSSRTRRRSSGLKLNT